MFTKGILWKIFVKEQYYESEKCVAILLTVILFVSSSTQLLTVVADEATTDIYIVEARGYAIDSLQKNYGGEKVNGENLLTDVELTGSEARSLRNRFSVLSIEKDIILTGDSSNEAEETEGTISQWNLDAIGITNETLEIEPTQKVKVAIIDSGVSYTGDILVENSINLLEDENENPLFEDISGHGTAMAGIICAADDDIGITGINANALLYSAKVLDENNQSPLSRILQGIYWAIENEVDIINMSFGTSVNSEILHDAIKDAYNSGILLVASSGNNSESGVKYPAAYDEVIAVGATDSTGAIWSDTSVGNELDLLAPGEKIITSGFLGGTLVTSGTSISTAEVSAVASLLLQKDTTKSANFIRKLLITSAKQVGDYGLVDYAYANEIYDDFATNYSEEDIEPDFLNTSSPVDYSEIADCIVDGMWGCGTITTSNDNISTDRNKKTHAGMSLDAAKNATLTDYYARVVQYACVKADAYKLTYSSSSDPVKVSAFHGRGNYVANISFMSHFAQQILGGVAYETAISNAAAKFPNLIKKTTVNGKAVYSSVSNNKNYSYHGKSYTSNGKLANTDGLVLVQMIDAIRCIWSELNAKTCILYDFTSNNSSIGSNRKFLVFVGLVLHMIGDVYSHRTIVPQYAITNMSGTPNDNTHTSSFTKSDFAPNSTATKTATESALREHLTLVTPFTYNSKLATINYYRSWKVFQLAVEKEIVEFQSVALFEVYSDPVGDKHIVGYKAYDDNPNMCGERFTDAKRLCNLYLSDVIKKNFNSYTAVVDFEIKYLFPSDDEIKLNNFKKYAIAAGYATGSGTAFYGQWKDHSVFNIVDITD